MQVSRDYQLYRDMVRTALGHETFRFFAPRHGAEGYRLQILKDHLNGFETNQQILRTFQLSERQEVGGSVLLRLTPIASPA